MKSRFLVSTALALSVAGCGLGSPQAPVHKQAQGPFQVMQLPQNAGQPEAQLPPASQEEQGQIPTLADLKDLIPQHLTKQEAQEVISQAKDINKLSQEARTEEEGTQGANPDEAVAPAPNLRSIEALQIQARGGRRGGGARSFGRGGSGRIGGGIGRGNGQIGRVGGQIGRVERGPGRVGGGIGQVERGPGRVGGGIGRVERGPGRIGGEIGRVERGPGRVGRVPGRGNGEIGRIGRGPGRGNGEIGRIGRGPGRGNGEIGRIGRGPGRGNGGLGRIGRGASRSWNLADRNMFRMRHPFFRNFRFARFFANHGYFRYFNFNDLYYLPYFSQFFNAFYVGSIFYYPLVYGGIPYYVEYCPTPAGDMVPCGVIPYSSFRPGL